VALPSLITTSSAFSVGCSAILLNGCSITCSPFVTVVTADATLGLAACGHASNLTFTVLTNAPDGIGSELFVLVRATGFTELHTAGILFIDALITDQFPALAFPGKLGCGPASMG
jgi:hypothetical protein